MEAIKELTRIKDKLQAQIHSLEVETAAIEKAIQLLERENRPETVLVQEKRFSKLGLSDACREIAGAEWLSPLEVREQLMRGGFKSDDKVKLLNSVFATLKRLAKMGELEARRVDSKLKYRKRQAAEQTVA